MQTIFNPIRINTMVNQLNVDPNHENIQAVRCCEKSGFEQSDYSKDPACCIMLKSIKKR